MIRTKRSFELSIPEIWKLLGNIWEAWIISYVPVEHIQLIHLHQVKVILKSRVSFELSNVSFEISKVRFKLSKVCFKVSKVRFKISMVRFKVSKVSFLSIKGQF